MRCADRGLPEHIDISSVGVLLCQRFGELGEKLCVDGCGYAAGDPGVENGSL